MIVRRTQLILAVALLLGATSSPLHAQYGPSLRGAGVSGAYAAMALGHEAVDWNPALLGMPTSPLVSLGLPRVNLGWSMVGVSGGSLLNILRDGADITDNDRLDFLADIPADGMEVRGDAYIPWLGFNVGPLAVGVSTTVLAGGSVGREFLDLLLYTRQYGDIDPTKLAQYRVGNTAGRQATFTTIKAGYGQALDEILPLPFPVSVGATVRYVHGHSLSRTRIFEPHVDLAAQDLFVSVLAVSAPGGQGYGLDLGAAARPIPGLTLSFAIDNFMQSMTWSEDLEIRGDALAGSEIGELDLGDLSERFEARPYDPNSSSLEAYEVAREIYTEAFFPVVVRMGAAYELGGTTLGATYSSVKGEGDLHLGWPRYVAVGVEQKLPIFSIVAVRAGLASSLSGATALSGGASLRLGPVHIAGALSRTTGHAEPAEPGFASRRFAERAAAGSGYVATFGVELLRF